MADSREQLSDEEAAELAAFADGSLTDDRRYLVAARLQRSPELAALVAEQRAVLDAIDAIEVDAPAGLRARIAQSAPPRRDASRRRGGFALFAGLAAVATAAIVAVVLIGGGASAPSIDQVASLYGDGASAPAPDRASENLLAASVDGVSFPDYEAALGWRAAGGRSDDLDGRATETVFYERGGASVAYSIVPGAQLAWQDGARTTIRDGVELHVLEEGGETVVSWLRRGHTCVLTGGDVPAGELTELAAWQGEGSVEF